MQRRGEKKRVKNQILATHLTLTESEDDPSGCMDAPGAHGAVVGTALGPDVGCGHL